MSIIEELKFAFFNASNMKFVPKSWGWELWIVNNEKYCGKILFIKAGHRCSYHYHKVKDEVLYVQSGELGFKYQTPGQSVCNTVLRENEACHVVPNTLHQMAAVIDTTIIEFSTQHFDDDSYRIDANGNHVDAQGNPLTVEGTNAP